MMSRFMDPSQLIDGESADGHNNNDAAQERKRKLTKKELKEFKERRKARKREAQLKLL